MFYYGSSHPKIKYIHKYDNLTEISNEEKITTYTRLLLMKDISTYQLVYITKLEILITIRLYLVAMWSSTNHRQVIIGNLQCLKFFFHSKTNNIILKTNTVPTGSQNLMQL